jgi:hypothetical protein
MPSLPVETPEDVAALVELAELPDADRRGLGDHFAFVAAVHPEWFRPYQEQVITRMLDRVDVGFAEQCLLFADAPETCVHRLADRLRERWRPGPARALAAIGTDAALAAVADDVRHGGDASEYARLGVWVPPAGAAEFRFTPHRRVVELRETGDPLAAVHPVGLPVEQVVRDRIATLVSWHYVSLCLADLPGMPAWPAERVHLVGARSPAAWTLTAGIDERGRLCDDAAVFEATMDPDVDAALRAQEAAGGGEGEVRLRPYDDDLLYCNGHVQLTPGVVGTVGGPPLGLHPNPMCRSCSRLMFHIATVESQIREYGDGWRALFVCAECRVVSCLATPWA